MSLNTLQDLNGDDCDEKSTLIYVKDPEAFILRAIEGRKVTRPFVSIGWDGGQDKLLLVLQIHDLANPDPAFWKDGGRRRSIILARGKSSICFIILSTRIETGKSVKLTFIHVHRVNFYYCV